MNMNIRHLEEFDEYCRVIFLEFTQEYILNLLQFPSVFSGKRTKEYEMVRKFFLHELDKEEASQRAYIDFIPMKETKVVHDCFDKIAVGLQKRTPKSNFQIAGAMIGMLSALFDGALYTNTPVAFGNTSERELFDQITSYIREKDGQVRRKDLEEKFSYSGDYLYKTVEKYTGCLCMNIARNLQWKRRRDFFWIRILRLQKSWRTLALVIGHNFTGFFEKIME